MSSLKYKTIIFKNKQKPMCYNYYAKFNNKIVKSDLSVIKSYKNIINKHKFLNKHKYNIASQNSVDSV